tara:strand:- start:575 stop:2026 length:1452 start_codon:yes stop_codon:yes gene_type:complete
MAFVGYSINDSREQSVTVNDRAAVPHEVYLDICDLLAAFRVKVRGEVLPFFGGIERAMVHRLNHKEPLPDAQTSYELALAAQEALCGLQEVMDRFKARENKARNEKRSIMLPSSYVLLEPKTMTDEEYMKFALPRIKNGTKGFEPGCGLTFDSLNEMIEVEGPEMARKKYQATVWAKKEFEGQDMPTTAEAALKLHTEHLTLPSTSKKGQGAASNPKSDVEIRFNFEDLDTAQTMKTFYVAKRFVGALKENTEVVPHKNIITAASEVLSASTASDMKFADFIDGVWKVCSGDVEGRGKDIPSIKANFASANNTLTRAYLLLLVCRQQFKFPEDAVAAKVEYKDLSIKLSALKKNLSSRTTPAVPLDLSAEKVMTTEKGKEQEDGAITAAVPAADVLGGVQPTVTAAADDDDKQAKSNDVRMVPSSAVPPPVSPSEQYKNGGPTNGLGLGIGKGLMKRPASPPSQDVETPAKRSLRSSALGGGQ